MIRLKTPINHSVSCDFVRAHLENGVRLGLNRKQLLKQAQITEAQLAGGERVLPKQLAMLVLNIMITADDEFLGCSLNTCKFGMFTLLSEKLIHCENLQAVFEETHRFYQLTGHDLSFELHDTGNNHTALRINRVLPQQDSSNLLIEFLLLIWHRFSSWLYGEVIPLKEVRTTYSAPIHASEYHLLFPCPSKFNAPHNELIFSTEILKQPIHRNAAQLQEYLKQVPSVWFKKPRFADDYTERVTRQLQQAANIQDTTIIDTAEELLTTPRTLRRKLTTEGIRFQEIKDQIRRDRAIYWLKQPNMSITEAANHCQYTETAAFIRAFKGWTGLTPGAYRKQLLQN